MHVDTSMTCRYSLAQNIQSHFMLKCIIKSIVKYIPTNAANSYFQLEHEWRGFECNNYNVLLMLNNPRFLPGMTLANNNSLHSRNNNNVAYDDPGK